MAIVEPVLNNPRLQVIDQYDRANGGVRDSSALVPALRDISR